MLRKNFTLSDESVERLSRLSTEYGMNQSELIRYMLEHYSGYPRVEFISGKLNDAGYPVCYFIDDTGRRTEIVCIRPKTSTSSDEVCVVIGDQPRVEFDHIITIDFRNDLHGYRADRAIVFSSAGIIRMASFSGWDNLSSYIDVGDFVVIESVFPMPKGEHRSWSVLLYDGSLITNISYVVGS